MGEVVAVDDYLAPVVSVEVVDSSSTSDYHVSLASEFTDCQSNVKEHPWVADSMLR